MVEKIEKMLTTNNTKKHILLFLSIPFAVIVGLMLKGDMKPQDYDPLFRFLDGYGKWIIMMYLGAGSVLKSARAFAAGRNGQIVPEK